jgi:hypothetical protein
MWREATASPAAGWAKVGEDFMVSGLDDDNAPRINLYCDGEHRAAVEDTHVRRDQEVDNAPAINAHWFEIHGLVRQVQRNGLRSTCSRINSRLTVGITTHKANYGQ